MNSAICIGVPRILPMYYGGRPMDCPGADLDADRIARLCLRNGITAACAIAEFATKSRLYGLFDFYADRLQPNDLFILAVSSHSGQTPDRNGDESDGLDETICLYDGQLVDDAVSSLLSTLPPSIRIVIFSDLCHAEGNFRGMVRRTTRSLTFGRFGKLIARPLHRRSSPLPLQIIQFAGCREGAVSYGGASGGQWTNCLLAAFDPALTWRQWFDRAASNMPRDQVPVWVQSDTVLPAFVNGTVMK